MDFARVRHAGREAWAVVDGHDVRLLPAAPWLAGPPWAQHATAAPPLEEGSFTWLPPVHPGKIVCVGRNYALHAAERGVDVPAQPLLFLKAPTALIVSGDDVLLPPESEHVECEGELAFVVSRRVRRFDGGDPSSVILGWLCADDVTARDLQRTEGQWTRAKGFDTSCPVSRVVRSVAPPQGARLVTRVGGVPRQDAPLDEMVFDVPAILAHASAMMTLEPGDLVLTGTPAGCARLAPGDVVEVAIDGLDPLRHGVRTA